MTATESVPRQLWPEDKLPYTSPFSYAKAIIKDEITYPIVPICPIINVDDPEAFDASNIPVGAFVIMHYQGWNWRYEFLSLRVPDDTGTVSQAELWSRGFIVISSRGNSSSPGGGNVM